MTSARDYARGVNPDHPATTIKKDAVTGDPRLNGFNYGAPLPIADTAKPYHDAVSLSDRLRDIAHQASARSWRLDMACREYRIACDPVERLNAQAHIEAAYSELYRFAPLDGGTPSADTPFEVLSGLGKTPLGDRPAHKGYLEQETGAKRPWHRRPDLENVDLEDGGIHRIT